MVNSVNGDRGSSVLPIPDTTDDFVFLGRGRHVILNGSRVFMNGTSGTSLENGIVASGESKMTSIRNTSASMKLIQLISTETEGDYILAYGGYSIS